MKNPKVSVLTPLYNTNPVHLREAIESILSQTFKDFEFILLNDSPDNVRLKEIISSYKDPRIVYVENERNLGISASRNRLLDLARGEYVAIFDHDDISMPERLEKQVTYLDTNPFIGVVSSNTEWFPKTEIHRHPEDNLDIKRTLMYSDVVAHSAMMVRKSVLDENKIRYEVEYSPAEDYMLCIRLLGKTMFHNIQEVLLKYRFSELNTTHKQCDKMRDASALIRCIAMKEYPLFCEDCAGNLKQQKPRKEWICLFFFIPILKIRHGHEKSRIFLFGFIPLFSVKKFF